jgi:hypothetical protein
MISQIEPGGSCDPSGTGSNSNQRAILMAKATTHDSTSVPIVSYLLTDFIILLATAALGTFIIAAAIV